METTLLARIGFSRLRLPIPTVKLSVIHAAAEILQKGAQSEILWDALIELLATLDLESEVVEALCIPVLAKDANQVLVGALQRAIVRPSPLSDLYLTEISGRPLLINSWSKCHSGEVPPLFSANYHIEELSAGRIVPPIMSNRLKKLEKISGGLPFLKQWAYEYQRLIDRLGKPSAGTFEYFIDGERGRNIGQFIARRGHFARSAYLRTLSLAFDCWNMPKNLVYEEAMQATPADFTFLRMLPSEPPSWVDIINDRSPVSQQDWQNFTNSIVQKVAEDDTLPELLHLNMPLKSTTNYQAEVELISCLHTTEKLNPEDTFVLHEFLPGHAKLPRTKNWDISDLPQDINNPFPVNNSGAIFPVLVPCVTSYAGYLHSDLISRMPYLPANYSSQMNILARSRLGGMDLLLGDQPIGEIKHWNCQWSPTHDQFMGPHCGISLAVSQECYRELLSINGTVFTRFWRAKVLTREKEYGKWEEKLLFGELPRAI